MISLFDWQQPSAAALESAFRQFGVAADGSDTGTGKTYKVLHVVRRLGLRAVVLCPKSMIAEWENVARMAGVPCQVLNYEKVRAGKTVHGRWQVKGSVFFWNIDPANTVLVFDEAHRLGGMRTQNALMLVAAKRQNLRMFLLSATLIGSPLKAWAVGYALGLHGLVNFWQWARPLGVMEGVFGPEWAPHRLKPPADAEEIMRRMREALGSKFTRIRKTDVPNFPQCQLVPTFVQTEELPDFSEYVGGMGGMTARMGIENAMVPGLTDKVRDSIDEGFSVAVFVNFVEPLETLKKAFPHAAIVQGGQSKTARQAAIDAFQNNTTDVILLMAQAGGTGVNLHDLHGKPRVAYVIPGNDAVEFLQVLGRIHRAGSLSSAINYVVFASGSPSHRRIRRRLEHKLTSLSALNDHDLNDDPSYAYGPTDQLPDIAAGPRPTDGAAEDAVAAPPDQHRLAGGEGLATDPLPGGAGRDAPRPDDLGSREPSKRSAGRSGGREGSGAGCGGGPAMSPVIDVVATPVPTEPQQVSTPAGEHAERKHARCSPSKLKNLEICPSYEPDNDGPVHPVTLRGTAMHEALETGDDSKLLPDNDNEELRLVTMCRDFQAGEAVPGETVILEPHLKTHDKDVQGFADRVVLEPVRPDGTRRIRIRDYKMGWNAVETPDRNPQAIAYTVAAFLAYPEASEVDFAFLIPRIDQVLQHTFQRSDLPELKLRLSVIADRVRKLAGKEYHLDYENCFYCGAKATCPVMLERMLPVRKAVAPEDQLPVPSTFNLDEVTKPEDVAMILNMANMAEKFAEKAKAFGLRYRLELGQEVPGYDLIERSAKREITDAVAAYEVAKEFGVSEGEYLASAKISITALETAVKANAPRGTKEQKAKEFTDRLMDASALSRGASFHVLQRTKKRKNPQIATT